MNPIPVAALALLEQSLQFWQAEGESNRGKNGRG